jgi:hypothetical protein
MFDFDTDKDGSYLDQIFGHTSRYVLTLAGTGIGLMAGGP